MKGSFSMTQKRFMKGIFSITQIGKTWVFSMELLKKYQLACWEFVLGFKAPQETR